VGALLARQETQPAMADFDLARLQRTLVVGSYGSGKTTAGRRLARALASLFVEQDAINWQANWTSLMAVDVDLFRERVADAVRGDRWVADGNFSAARDIVWPQATAVLWFDYRIDVVMRRVFARTVRRALRREELWNGNRENLRFQIFNRDSIFLLAFRSHWRMRRTYETMLHMPEQAHLHVYRMRRPSDTERWLQQVEDVAATCSAGARSRD
jgi:adenylate kinase family enzyme